MINEKFPLEKCQRFGIDFVKHNKDFHSIKNFSHILIELVLIKFLFYFQTSQKTHAHYPRCHAHPLRFKQNRKQLQTKQREQRRKDEVNNRICRKHKLSVCLQEKFALNDLKCNWK